MWYLNYLYLKEEYTVNSKLDCEEELDNIKMEPWSSRKMGILSKFTTSEKLCIISVLPDGEKGTDFNKK